MKNGNGKHKTTRDEYDRAKRVLDRWEQKVLNAKALVQFWEATEAQNKDSIGKNVLTAIVRDTNGTTIRCESPALRNADAAMTNAAE